MGPYGTTAAVFMPLFFPLMAHEKSEHSGPLILASLLLKQLWHKQEGETLKLSMYNDNRVSKS